MRVWLGRYDDSTSQEKKNITLILYNYREKSEGRSRKTNSAGHTAQAKIKRRLKAVKNDNKNSN